jgi:hypothetical protein
VWLSLHPAAQNEIDLALDTTADGRTPDTLEVLAIYDLGHAIWPKIAEHVERPKGAALKRAMKSTPPSDTQPPSRRGVPPPRVAEFELPRLIHAPPRLQPAASIFFVKAWLFAILAMASNSDLADTLAIPNREPIPIKIGPDGKHSVECPKCRTRIALPKRGRNANFWKHYDVCVDVFAAVVPPQHPQLSQLMISESPAMSRAPSPSSPRNTTPTTPRAISPHRSSFRRTTVTPERPATPSTELLSSCAGFTIEPTSALLRYPLARHQDHDLGWFLVSMDPDGRHIVIKSTRCKGASAFGRTCAECVKVCNSTDLAEFLDRIAEALPNTPYEYLSFEQLLAVVDKQHKELRQLRTQVANMKRSRLVSKTKLTFHTRIQHLLASQNIPGLRRVMQRAVDVRQMSPGLVYATLQKVIAGTYKPRGRWSERELDMAFLAKVASGPRFLGALNRTDGYASARSIRRNFDVPQLLVSIGKPSNLEVNSNIHAFFNSSILKPATAVGVWKDRQPGVEMMWDNVAIEQRCQQCPIRNMPIGHCREHGQHWPSFRIDSDDNILAMKHAAEDPEAELKLCYGKEATVIAIAPMVPLPPTNTYHAIPVLVSPSCNSPRRVQDSMELQLRAPSLGGPRFGRQDTRAPAQHMDRSVCFANRRGIVRD